MARLRLKELARLKRAYRMQRVHAVDRNIPFLLNFIEWLTIWRESGHLHERGQGKGQFCMARYGDIGPYAVGNVRICTGAENALEGWNNPDTRAIRAAKVSTWSKGKKLSPEHKEKLHSANRGRKPTTETIEKLRQAHLGKTHSPEAIENMKIAQQRRRDNETNLGKIPTHSSETIEKMKLSQQRRREREREAFRATIITAQPPVES